ncbi:hypothetical protein BKH44_02445 [Helicobacter sp. 13S00477-4]|nr:hypothetical protein BKH44_02445 [Helicobacter sp. 13S00477-4]
MSFFLSIQFSHADTPASIIQKPTDKPKDRQIKIKVHDGGIFCYAPVFSGGESYIQIQGCSEQETIAARYDVFQRISYNIDDTWLCITAPENVIKAEAQWDYVHLRPCTVNDVNQRWIVKDNAFWTADGMYRLKDYEWYGYISRNSKDNYNHTLDVSMKEWLNTIATPGNLTIQTSLGWDLDSDRYFIKNNSSSKNTTDLYYNVENGHIAQYNIISGNLYCMASDIGKNNWDWITWELCNDKPSKKENNPKFWDISFIGDDGGVIRDFEGNVLRVSRYGTNWGVPYSVKPNYLKTDTSKSPISLFIIEKDLRDWSRYINGNLGDNLQYCPAPGFEKKITKKRVIRELPHDFVLDESWIRRLYDIAVSSNYRSELQGRCGICFLQSLQMIAELQEHNGQGPLQRTGYFFDTMPGVNPFISFRNRFPLLHDSISEIFDWYPPIHPAETPMSILRRSFSAVAISMLPQYELIPSNIAYNQSDILAELGVLLNSSPGSLWIAAFSQILPDGRTNGHAVPIIRTTQGLVILQANVNITLARYRELAQPTTDLQTVLSNLALPRARITTFFTYHVTTLPQNRFDMIVSNNNCTGDGDDRRGTLSFPSSASINQCKSGRCAW